MKTNLMIELAIGLTLICAPIIQAQNFSAEDLHRRTNEHRALEAVMGDIPLVNSAFAQTITTFAGASASLHRQQRRTAHGPEELSRAALQRSAPRRVLVADHV